MKNEISNAAVKIVPAWGGAVYANVAGLSWGELAAIATIAYTGLQAYVTIRRHFFRKRGRGDE